MDHALTSLCETLLTTDDDYDMSKCALKNWMDSTVKQGLTIDDAMTRTISQWQQIERILAQTARDCTLTVVDVLQCWESQSEPIDECVQREVRRWQDNVDAMTRQPELPELPKREQTVWDTTANQTVNVALEPTWAPPRPRPPRQSYELGDTKRVLEFALVPSVGGEPPEPKPEPEPEPEPETNNEHAVWTILSPPPHEKEPEPEPQPHSHPHPRASVDEQEEATMLPARAKLDRDQMMKEVMDAEPARVIEILKFTTDPMVEKQVWTIVARRSDPVISGKSTAFGEEFVTEDGIKAAVFAISRHESAAVLLQILHALATLTRSNTGCDRFDSLNGVAEVVVRTMIAHRDTAEIQAVTCIVLDNWCILGDDKRTLRIVAAGGIEAVLWAMNRHRLDVEVQASACRLLQEMASYQPADLSSTIDTVVKAMNTHPSSAEVQHFGCGVLLNLAQNSKARCAAIIGAGGEETIKRAAEVCTSHRPASALKWLKITMQATHCVTRDCSLRKIPSSARQIARGDYADDPVLSPGDTVAVLREETDLETGLVMMSLVRPCKSWERTGYIRSDCLDDLQSQLGQSVVVKR